MKKYSMILAVVMVAFAAVAPAMAQNEAPTYAAYMTADHNMRSSKLIGLPVYNDHGEKIGVIDDIMLPTMGGEVTAAVSVGGFMGIGEDYYPLPWSMLTYNPKLEGYEVNISETQLKGAPKYSTHETWDWDSRTRAIDDYYKVQPTWVM